MIFRVVAYKNLVRSFFRFVTILAFDGQTNRRTDIFLIARPRLHSMQRGKMIFRLPIPDDAIYRYRKETIIDIFHMKVSLTYLTKQFGYDCVLYDKHPFLM